MGATYANLFPGPGARDRARLGARPRRLHARPRPVLAARRQPAQRPPTRCGSSSTRATRPASGARSRPATRGEFDGLMERMRAARCSASPTRRRSTPCAARCRSRPCGRSWRRSWPPCATARRAARLAASRTRVRQQPGGADRDRLLGDRQPARPARVAARGPDRRRVHAVLRLAVGVHLAGVRDLAGFDRDRYTGPFDRKTAAPLLLVNARYDAFSSLARARKVADSMPGARLLTVDGPGHTLEGTDSACADRAVERYLVAGKLPGQGRRLRPGQHAVLDLVQVLDVRPVVVVRRRPGGEPGVEDLGEHRLGGGAQREREHVGVVPLAGAGGGLGVAAQRGADAGDLVGGDRGARAGPAGDDGLVGAALGDVAGGGLGGPRPVVALVGVERAVQQRLVAAGAQLLDQRRGRRRCPRRRRRRSSSRPTVPAAARGRDRDRVARLEPGARLRAELAAVEPVVPGLPGLPPLAPRGGWRRRSDRIDISHGSSTVISRMTPSPPGWRPSPPLPAAARSARRAADRRSRAPRPAC